MVTLSLADLRTGPIAAPRMGQCVEVVPGADHLLTDPVAGATPVTAPQELAQTSARRTSRALPVHS